MPSGVREHARLSTGHGMVVGRSADDSDQQTPPAAVKLERSKLQSKGDAILVEHAGGVIAIVSEAIQEPSSA
jgi:hypothetical protein